MAESSRGSRPGGRSARVQNAVFEATLAEFVECGYTALTIERIAARAGVHKTTVYRRWTDRDALLAAAVRDLAQIPVPALDTGSLRSDLQAYAHGIVEVLTGPAGGVARTAMSSDAIRVPEIAQIKQLLISTRRPISTKIVARAVDRGELAADTDPHALIDFLVAPLYFRLLISEEPLDGELADQVSIATLAAARDGAFGSAGRR
ncbi:TetR/AcrR family transcriptional regulator [Microlunatus sp. GCM10028923]|uniref:TetR/AcrR family transcriptional regulator n=1 Tax=Microlunatus sp. GCM10028923 TaxID=3273400 RepID=UPI0036218B05